MNLANLKHWAVPIERSVRSNFSAGQNVGQPAIKLSIWGTREKSRMTVTWKERREREAGISPRGFAARSYVLPVSLASLDRNQMKESMRCLRAKNSSDAL